MVKRTLEGNEYKYQIRDSRLFKKNSFSTFHVGENKTHRLIKGKLKKNNNFKTHSVIIEKDLDKRYRGETNLIIREALRE